MSLPTRDAQGYPIAGIDVVPHYPPKPSPTKSAQLTAQLTSLLLEANRREADLRDSVEYWRKKYKTLYQEHAALKFGDLCYKCQTLRDTTPPGDTITICRDCSEGKVTLQSLRLELAKKDEEIRYWRDCFETALENHDGRGDDGPHPRV